MTCVVEEAQSVREELSNAHPASVAPCHCDPFAKNFLDTGDTMWVVELGVNSGMNDPLWDLGEPVGQAVRTQADGS